jgi:hypothetical protein
LPCGTVLAHSRTAQKKQNGLGGAVKNPEILDFGTLLDTG